MLETRYKFKDPSYKEDDYALTCWRDEGWHNSSNKVLIILDTIDSNDLREGRLLTDRPRTVLTNLFNWSIRQAKQDGLKRSDLSLAAVNFNNRKFFDQPKETHSGFRKTFTTRVNRIIDDLKPTTIIVFGDNAAQAMMPDRPGINRYRGWVFDYKTRGGTRCKFVNSLDLYSLYSGQKKAKQDEDDLDDDSSQGEDAFGESNLLFYCTEHVINALLGRMRFDLSHVKVRPVYVDTLEKFKKFWPKLIAAKDIGVDTETKNLSVNNNHISTIQFCLDDSMKGYMIPLRHPQSPFKGKELDYIERHLKKFFRSEPGTYAVKTLIFQNGKFDLRVIRAEWGIPIIKHAVWEITAGEWVNDENRKTLVDFGTPHGGLAQIFLSYGNDHYEKAAFGKEDRSNAELTRLDNPDFIEYGCMDTVSIWFIKQMQEERAKRLQIGNKNFLPFFRRAVRYQMSNTVNLLSHMKQYGATVDKDWLRYLKGKDSPMLNLMAQAETKLREYPEVIAANHKVLGVASSQASMKGLFGREMMVWKPSKADHLEALVFDVMDLKHLSTTATGKRQINKDFLSAYRKDYPIIDDIAKWKKLQKLYSTYIKGWWNKIRKDIDSSKDWRLRADYGFYGVVTGRLNSFDPNLQQVPSRGEESKYIKRAFRSPKGSIHIKYDYSAHEVRGWSIVSGDEVLAETFKMGQKMRQSLRRSEKKRLVDKVTEILKELKRSGDIHILNIKFFFDRWVEKSDPLRDAIKAVVFGVIYQKSAKSLGRDLQKDAVTRKEDEIRNMRKRIEEIKKQLGI